MMNEFVALLNCTHADALVPEVTGEVDDGGVPTAHVHMLPTAPTTFDATLVTNCVAGTIMFVLTQPVVAGVVVVVVVVVVPPPVSVWQFALQPSPFVVFPSSQCSVPSVFPSPHVTVTHAVTPLLFRHWYPVQQLPVTPAPQVSFRLRQLATAVVHDPAVQRLLQQE